LLEEGWARSQLGKTSYRLDFVIFVIHYLFYRITKHTKVMPTPHHPSAAVRKALGKLGSDLRDARRRRRLPMAVLADRAFTSRATLQRVEAGDPAVSMGIYAAVMHSLGLLDGLGQLADASTDSVGQALANEFLPQRVRLKKTKEQP
jgi:transcriptional regulator with XRE-family HTH domain